MEQKSDDIATSGTEATFGDGFFKGGTKIKFGGGVLQSIAQKDQNRIIQMIAEQAAARIQKNPSPETLETFESDLKKRIEENSDILSWDSDYEEIVSRVRTLLRRRS